MKTVSSGAVGELNQRSREIFREIVANYLTTGDPTGSRTLSRQLADPLSPATIRNVMADLEDMGLLYAPHTSAGRLPTETGLRLFVDGLLEIGNLTEAERENIESQCAAAGKSVTEAMEEATSALSGLSRCTGLVLAPKLDRALRHTEFVNLGDGKALVVMVSEDGHVENRVIDLPQGTPAAVLIQATNYLNVRLLGRTIDEARGEIMREIEGHQAQLDTLTGKVVQAGLATWTGEGREASLIIKGQAHLLEDVSALADLEYIRTLFEALDTKDLIARLLELTRDAEGVQIYIGAEDELFNLSGCSLIAAPFADSRDQIIGAIGVIGPTRINYARIIPIVDYTAQVLSRVVG